MLVVWKQLSQRRELSERFLVLPAVCRPLGCVCAREGLAAENHANMARILAEHGAPAYRRRPGRDVSFTAGRCTVYHR